MNRTELWDMCDVGITQLMKCSSVVILNLLIESFFTIRILRHTMLAVMSQETHSL